MKPGSTLILTCAVLSLWSPAEAQARLLPGQTLRALPEATAPADPRIDALEARVAALTQRLERAENSAREANFKAGAAASWIDSHGPGLLNHTHSYSDRTTWVSHYCDNARAGPDEVGCSQITGSSPGTTSPPQ